MKLTGKAKEQFEKWYDEKSQPITLRAFWLMSKSMQWGVYQDWADSLGYEINVLRLSENFYDWSVWVNGEAKIHSAKNRQEARNAAIEKLNELINEK